MTTYNHTDTYTQTWHIDHIGNRGYLNRLRKRIRQNKAYVKRLGRSNLPFVRKLARERDYRYPLMQLRPKYMRY